MHTDAYRTTSKLYKYISDVLYINLNKLYRDLFKLYTKIVRNIIDIFKENKDKLILAFNKNNNLKHVKHSLSIPTTIQEHSYIHSRLHSRQSMSNLQEYSHEHYDSKVDNRFHIISILYYILLF